jgi:hypothetical protein
MSHDRGCYCGREKYEYDDCINVNCSRRSPPAVREETLDKIVHEPNIKPTQYKNLELNGYVIVPPLSKWDEKFSSQIIPEMSCHTFGKTATEAWSLQSKTLPTDIEFLTKVQAWHDKGYRLKKAKLTIEYGNE